MQSKFQNKVVLPKTTREAHCVISLNIVSAPLLPNIIWTFTDLDKGTPSRVVLIGEVLLYSSNS
jgi:hypothetical protein